MLGSLEGCTFGLFVSGIDGNCVGDKEVSDGVVDIVFDCNVGRIVS